MSEEIVNKEETIETDHSVDMEQSSDDTVGDDKVGIDDVGKGLILLAGILILCYLALLIVSALVQVEPGQIIWTLPSYMVGTIAISIILITIGLALLRINARRKRA